MPMISICIMGYCAKRAIMLDSNVKICISWKRRDRYELCNACSTYIDMQSVRRKNFFLNFQLVYPRRFFTRYLLPVMSVPEKKKNRINSRCQRSVSFRRRFSRWYWFFLQSDIGVFCITRRSMENRAKGTKSARSGASMIFNDSHRVKKRAG